jgi:hypothetical protein
MTIQFSEDFWTVTAHPIPAVGARAAGDDAPASADEVAIVLSSDTGKRRITGLT